ncbi:hypothetical protein D3C71_1685650 [compost metagenome]
MVAVRDPEAAAIRRGVHRIGPHLDASKRVAYERAGKFVMVTRHKHHPTPLARTAQQLLHHIVVGLWPEPLAAQLPAIDDVAHKVEVIAGVVLEKVQQRNRLATRRAQMQIRNKDRAVPTMAGG